MPRKNSASRTPKLPEDDAPSAPAASSAPSAASFQRGRTLPSTGSLAGAEDGPEDASTRSTEPHNNKNSKNNRSSSTPAPDPTSFPAQPPEHTALPVIASPPSATGASVSATPLNDGRGSPQRPRPVQQRVSRTSLSSTPPRSTETLHIARHSPAAANATAKRTPSERRADIDALRGGKGGHASSPGTPGAARPPSPAPHGSPIKVATPPPVSFAAHTATPTGQRTSPCPQALTSPPPQLTLQRPSSRSRPFLGGSVTGSLTGSLQGHSALQPPLDPLQQASVQRNGTTSAPPHEPSSRHTPSHSRAASQDSTHVTEAVPFSPVGEDDVVLVTSPSEEDKKDLLVEKIIRAPRRMGQSNASCERTQPPRAASNSRSSPEENVTRSQPPRRQSDHTPQRADSPAGVRAETRRTDSRQGRRTPPVSPGERVGPNRPCLLTAATPPPLPNGAEVDDAQWVFQRPPNNQRTFYFKEDNLEFSSQFDSGNLIQVERVGPFQYRMYTAMDCGNSPWQTNNRQWFHFSLRGGGKGVLVTFTFVGMMHSNMFNFDWMPVSAVVPSRPEYARLSGKAKVEATETMPETPGYPLLVHKTISRDDADSDGDNNEDDNEGDAGAGAATNGNSTSAGGVAFSIAPSGRPGGGGKKKKAKKKKCIAMNLTFEYKIEAEVPVTHTPPKGRPDVASIYLASNHPYSYTRLQRNLVAWQEQAKKSNATRSQSVQAAGKASLPSRAPADESPEARAAQTPTNTHLGEKSGDKSSSSGGGGTASTTETAFTGIYFHREVLCKTHESHDVTLLTISDRSRMTMERAPLISTADGIPFSSAHRTTERPFAFSGKKYVVLTARVHPGECPGSHLMHGCIEFLMNRTDPRAVALRHNFVFYVIPMLNPDGVVRGHSRVDANGVDLNRMYRAPSAKRHPAPYAVMALLRSLGDRVALFVDMHAHANKRGTFFYGNSMDGAEQVDNLLYAKLVSLNTPYLDFRSCNFSEANMFAVGKSGKGKDSSSRVVVYTETGVVHGYTIEASHVMAEAVNPIVTLVNAQGEELEKTLPAPLQLAHTPATFGDTGRAMLVALLDLKSINPISRLGFTPYHSTRGVSMWLQRQLQMETAELLFAQAFKSHGKEVQATYHETGNGLLGPMMRSLAGDEFPDKITIKKARLLPRTTYSGVRYFLPVETAVALLSQTAPTGPPRSLLYASSSGGGGSGGGGGHGRRRAASPATCTNNISAASGAGAAGAAASPSTAVPSSGLELPAVIAAKRRPRTNPAGAEATVES